MVARGANRRAGIHGELMDLQYLSLGRFAVMLIGKVNVPMDIERPPTNAKSIGFAPGKVSELR